MTRVVVFGPGPVFKGGLANYNTSLAKAFNKLEDVEVTIVSWTQQYPVIIPRDFIDRKSKGYLLEGTNIKVNYITNYNNPLSWNKTYKLIRNINPQMVIFQWAIAFQGIPLGFIAKKLKKHPEIEVIFDLHFVIQKEGSSIDNWFTKTGIKHADTYIVHSFKTARELETLFPRIQFNVLDMGKGEKKINTKVVIKLFHPVYDMFHPDKNFNREETKKELKLRKFTFLFFGFIRKYKGLHNTIRAFAKVAEIRDDVSLLIVGESFWSTLDSKKIATRIKKTVFNLLKLLFLRRQDDESDYRPLDLIGQLGIKDKVTLINEFVPNEEVHKYFQVSDSIVLYYLAATPSGVESVAYNFRLPILATRVGHFPETIIDGYNGYLADPDKIESMAEVMIKSIEKPIPGENVAKTSASMSWVNYAKTIIESHY
jgi:glycosyltransferase involved in cell wall biosynthesis